MARVGCQSGRVYWYHDGCYVYFPGEYGAQACFLVGSFPMGHFVKLFRSEIVSRVSTSAKQPLSALFGLSALPSFRELLFTPVVLLDHYLMLVRQPSECMYLSR